MGRFPLLFMASHFQKYFTQNIQNRFKNASPVAFNYSEICDCRVFNLNHYLLLSYSRMIKVVKRNITWDISIILTSLLQSFKSPNGDDFSQSYSRRATWERPLRLIKGSGRY